MCFFKKCLFLITALFHSDIIIIESLWHYFKTDIMTHLKHGCALCEIWEFHCVNMVILTKFLDFVTFGTRDLGHNGEKFRFFFYHFHKPSCMLYLLCRNNLSKLQFNFGHFIGQILTLRWPTSLLFLYHWNRIVICTKQNHIPFTWENSLKYTKWQLSFQNAHNASI
jgi:hypothetical protein